MGDPRQADRVEQVAGPLSLGGTAAPGWRLGEQQIPGGALVRQQVTGGILQQQADLLQPEPGQRTAAEFGEPTAIDLDGAGGRPQQSGQMPEQRGLPSARRAE